MIEKRYIVNADCLYNEILDTKFGSNGVDKPTKQEVEDKEYLIVCDVFPKSVADKLCERLNRYEQENKQFKEQIAEQGTQLDFLKDENKHMRAVLEENKKLKIRYEEYRKLSVQYKQKYDEKISDNTFLEEENKSLKAESEQLKERIKELEEEINSLSYGEAE